MDTLLEYLYCDVARRCWDGSASQKESREEFEAARGKDWGEIYNAAQLLAERQSFAVFLAAFHLGLTLENTFWQQRGVLF